MDNKTKRIIINSVFITLYTILYIFFKLNYFTINSIEYYFGLSELLWYIGFSELLWYTVPLSPIIVLLIIPHLLTLRIIAGRIPGLMQMLSRLENEEDEIDEPAQLRFLLKYLTRMLGRILGTLIFYWLCQVIFSWTIFAFLSSSLRAFVIEFDVNMRNVMGYLLWLVWIIFSIYLTRKIYFFVFSTRIGTDKKITDKGKLMAEINEKNIQALKYASKSLKSDREVVLAAVVQNGKALQYASDSFESDREVVLAAVNQYGEALRYASKDLRLELRNLV
jgi:hypothetical protein